VAVATIKLGKAQVVADRQADAADWRIESDARAPGFDRFRLVVALVALAECKQMDLVVAGNLLAVRIEYQRSAAHPRRVGRSDRHGAADQPQPLLARDARQKVLLRTVAVGLTRIDLVSGPGAEDAEVFGQQDERGALLSCRDDQRLDCGQV